MPDPRRWGPTKARPNSEGRALFRGLNGQLVAQAWPQPRGPNMPTRTALWAEYFGRVNKMFPFLHPAEWEGWMFTTFEGRLYPRDLFTASAMGRGFGVQRPDGTLIMPARTLYDISQTLDLFGSRPGTIFFRGQRQWEALPPGLPGTVLQMDDEGNRPFWSFDGGGGAGGNKLPTIEPVEKWDNVWSDGTLIEGPDSAGGFHAVLFGDGIGDKYATLEWSETWDGSRAIIGFDISAQGQSNMSLAFYARNNAADDIRGLIWANTVDRLPRLRYWFTDTMTTFGTAASTTYWAQPSTIFFGLEKTDTRLRLLAGPSPDTLYEKYAFFTPVGWPDLTTLGIRLRTTNDSGPPLAVRLAHCNIGAPE